MKKFKGSINGKIYTDENEFDIALSTLNRSGDVHVSYSIEFVPDLEIETKQKDATPIECNKNYVSESQYVKNINNKKDVDLDLELVNKLKCATNKSDIKRNVCKKIVDFDSKIDDNLIHINELKSDYKRLDERMKLINNQIKTLDDANNNYYLNKEYYTNIKNLLDNPVDIPESKEKCNCECENDTCKCDDKEKKISQPTLKDIYEMSPYDLAKYLNKRMIYTLADLVEYFLKNN
jgi:hypothetical protein